MHAPRSDILRDPKLLALVIASALSSLGTGIVGIAFTYLSYEISGSLVVSVLVIAVQALPAVFLIKLAQWLPRRFGLRSTNIAAQLAYTVVSLLGAIAISAGYLSISLLVLVSLGAGVVGALSYPAWNQLLRAVAPSGSDGSGGLVKLDAALQAGSALAGVAGLLIGGVLLTALGPAWLFTINAISYLFPILAFLYLGQVKKPDVGTGKQEGVWAALHMMLGQVKLRRIVIAAVALNLLAWPILRVLPGVASDINPSASTFSILMSSFYIGASLTPVIISRWRKSVGYEGVLARSVLMMLGGFALVWATSGITTTWVHMVVLVVLLALIGLGLTLAITVLNASIQVAAPDAQEAGLLAAYSAIITVTYPIGGLIVAGIGGRQGVWWAIAFELVGVALMFAVMWWKIGPELKAYSKVDVGHRILMHHSLHMSHGYTPHGETQPLQPATSKPSDDSSEPIA